ncbi:unnamed protein product [Rodentolepis nana]|uniref:Reverse transcriptase domain-containing protein n=1 Tax=Rodentolepis nana TaxID=102285 RepID=A0A0R3TL84_RODNA|nr:unnamed protein product [Rodentolepis nana]
MGPKAKETMLTLFNKIWETSLVPNQWKFVIVIPVLKNGKYPSNFDKYRLISLKSVLAKLIKRIANRRPTLFLETSNILRSEQAGFRPTRSTRQQIENFLATKINEPTSSHSLKHIKDVLDARNTLTSVFVTLDARNTLTAVFVGFKSAYDLVWKEKLIRKLVFQHIKDAIDARNMLFSSISNQHMT